MKDLKINIKKLRTRLDMKPEEFAEALGISLSELEQIEHGRPALENKSISMLRALYPKLNLQWFIEGPAIDYDQEEQKNEEGTLKSSLLPPNESEVASTVREGKHEQVAILFARKINQASWPSLNRVLSSDLFIYQFDGRYYLVVATNELEHVARQQVAKCLWIAPDPILNLFLPDSEIKQSIRSLASTFRSNYKAYGSVMVPNLYPEAATFNLFLECMVADKERLISSILESLTYEQILSTMDHISYEEIVYEGETYHIFDVTN